MLHPAIIKASALIQVGDIVGAESALMEMVETEGDSTAVALLDELPPKDLVAIIREYDASKNSVINLLITPQQFADAVIFERLYKEASHDRLRAMINSIIYRDDAEYDADDFISALTEKDQGVLVLADYLEDRFEEVNTFRHYGSFVASDEERIPDEEQDDTAKNEYFRSAAKGVGLDEVADQDWMELTWRLSHDHPDAFALVFQVLAERHWLHVREQEALERQLQARELGKEALGGSTVENNQEESAL